MATDHGRLAGRVAIITGASAGIGRATARLFAAEGAAVTLAARSADALHELAEELRAGGGQAVAVAADVTHAAQVGAMVDRARQEFGRIDILVNNAGIGVFAPVAELAEADWDAMMGVNLKGPFLCSRAVWPQFVAQGGGHIINVSSVAGTVTLEGGGGYCASKWGLMALADVLMKEGKPHRIKVSTICPGSVQTGFGGKTPGAKSYSLKPEDVAHLILDIAAQPPGVIVNQVVMRPLVPPGA